jgi:hypothetical protein
MALVGLILLAEACSGSDSSSPSGSGRAPNTGGPASAVSAVSYSHCMRSRGVPNYPDPDSSDQLPKTSAQLLGVSSSQFGEAQRACQQLLPASGGSLSATSLQQCHLAGVCPPALVKQALDAGLKFAQCMRSHRVPNWPDPTVNSEGEPVFNITVPRPAPPQVSGAINECERLEPAGSLLAWG